MRTKLFISALAVALSIGIVTAQNQNQVKKRKQLPHKMDLLLWTKTTTVFVII